MGEIKVGEYVRTKDGIIRQVKTIKSGRRRFSITTETRINGSTKLENIAKHSPNIIDLIEVGDYVNGREVKHIAMFEGFPDYPKLIFVDNKYLIPSETAENEDIKTILTKEQYKANCYEVK